MWCACFAFVHVLLPGCCTAKPPSEHKACSCEMTSALRQYHLAFPLCTAAPQADAPQAAPFCCSGTLLARPPVLRPTIIAARTVHGGCSTAPAQRRHVAPCRGQNAAGRLLRLRPAWLAPATNATSATLPDCMRKPRRPCGSAICLQNCVNMLHALSTFVPYSVTQLRGACASPASREAPPHELRHACL